MRAAELLLASLLVPAVSLAQKSENQPPPVDVDPAGLAKLIGSADRLVVTDWSEVSGYRDQVLFESAKRSDLESLKLALKLQVPDSPRSCFCSGWVAITFFAKDIQLAEITNQHSRAIRCSLWNSDAPLDDPEPLLKWFDERKISGPRKEYEEHAKKRLEKKEFEAAEKKWIEAMPKPLIPLWSEAARQDPDSLDLAPFRTALATQLEDRNERVLALLGWYGLGKGAWYPCPDYERVAEELLLDYPTAVLNSIGCSKDLTSAQIEGLARLLAGRTFSQRRPGELALVSAALKARLLEHVRAGDDAGKHWRAEDAFGGG